MFVRYFILTRVYEFLYNSNMSTQTIARRKARLLSSFPNKLREYRKQAGMTQEQLAKCLNVKQVNISKAETNGTGLGADTWFRISTLFDVDPRILRGWVPPEEDEPIAPQPV